MALSHPSRVRGLKSEGTEVDPITMKSHPSRVRGLKFAVAGHQHRPHSVAPFTGAWIEITRTPTVTVTLECRTLHGCVD